MNALGIAYARREEIDHQEMNPAAKKLGRLFSESSEGRPCALVARRNDFHDSNDAMAAYMPDDNAICFGSVYVSFGLRPVRDLRLRGRQS